MSNALTHAQKEELRAFVLRYGNPAYVKSLVMKLLPEEGVSIHATAETSTAYTYFDKGLKKHKIFLGTNQEGVSNISTDESTMAYALALFIHELGHTNYTEKEQEKLKAYLKEKKIPWSLVNLAEDARIEVKMKRLIRENMGTLYTFGWTNWFALPENDINMSPEAILLTIINSENDVATFNELLSVKKGRVGEYWKKFIDAKDVFEVIDELVNWVNEFYPKQQQDKNQKSSNENGQGGESQLGEQQLQQLQQAIEQLKDELKNSSGQGGDGALKEEGNDQETKGQEGGKGDNQVNSMPCLRNLEDMHDTMVLSDEDGGKAIMEALEAMSESFDAIIQESTRQRSLVSAIPKLNANTVQIVEASNTDKLINRENGCGDYNIEEYTKTLSLLKKIKQEGREKVNLRDPTSSFNESAMAFIKSSPNTVKLYQKNKIKQVAKSHKILFVLDLSGSMSGRPIEAQRTIILAANELALKVKWYKIDVMASKTTGRESLYQSIRLPADPEDLLGIQAGGGEGIGYAIKNNANLVREKDAVVFITDGNIGDMEISKEYVGKYLSSKARSIGMYVGSRKNLNEDMDSWFDVLISKPTVVEAVEEMIEVINAKMINGKLFSKKPHKANDLTPKKGKIQ